MHAAEHKDEGEGALGCQIMTSVTAVCKSNHLQPEDGKI
jgi:hypothetical protein